MAAPSELVEDDVFRFLPRLPQDAQSIRGHARGRLLSRFGECTGHLRWYTDGSPRAQVQGIPSSSPLGPDPLEIVNIRYETTQAVCTSQVDEASVHVQLSAAYRVQMRSRAWLSRARAAAIRGVWTLRNAPRTRFDRQELRTCRRGHWLHRECAMSWRHRRRRNGCELGRHGEHGEHGAQTAPISRKCYTNIHVLLSGIAM